LGAEARKNYVQPANFSDPDTVRPTFPSSAALIFPPPPQGGYREQAFDLLLLLLLRLLLLLLLPLLLTLSPRLCMIITLKVKSCSNLASSAYPE
jgi:hypothetical protein